ncbi:MAG: hypothetical protein WC560_07470 [Syntrophales bacterium]
MITAGIDVGIQTVKAFIVKDNQLLPHSLVKAGCDPAISLREAMEKARVSQLSSQISLDIQSLIVITSIVKKQCLIKFSNVGFEERIYFD